VLSCDAPVGSWSYPSQGRVRDLRVREIRLRPLGGGLAAERGRVGAASRGLCQHGYVRVEPFTVRNDHNMSLNTVRC
jgi:hypothetical protein